MEFSGQSVLFLDQFTAFFNSIGVSHYIDYLIWQKILRKSNPK